MTNKFVSPGPDRVEALERRLEEILELQRIATLFSTRQTEFILALAERIERLEDRHADEDRDRDTSWIHDAWESMYPC